MDRRPVNPAPPALDASLTVLISGVTCLVSTLTGFSTLLLSWRLDRRQSKETALHLAQMQFELDQARNRLSVLDDSFWIKRTGNSKTGPFGDADYAAGASGSSTRTGLTPAATSGSPDRLSTQAQVGDGRSVTRSAEPNRAL
jgi:hypothetical protein